MFYNCERVIVEKEDTMKKTKIHEVIAVQTEQDMIKMNERIGHYLGKGKKIDVKIKNGSVHITEQKRRA
jgi:hypothetical protein